MSDARQGGGFADRDEEFLAATPEHADATGGSVAEGAARATTTGALEAKPGASHFEAAGEDVAGPTRLGGVGAGDRMGAGEGAATTGLSAVAATNRRRWGMLLAGGVGVLAVASMIVWSALAPKKDRPPPPARPAPAQPADLMATPKPAAAPVPIQQAMVKPAQPKKTPTETLAEKAQRSPLMAATPNVAAVPTRQVAAASREGRAREALGAKSEGFGKGGAGITRVKAYTLGDPTFRLSAGTPIPCVLDTAMDTTIAGMVRCHLEHDVLSANQTVVLLDAGTVIIGEYRANLKQGQERIGIVWTRAETPNSIAVDVQSPGVDPLGRAGVDGEIETYFWTRFGAALMFSLVEDVGQVARSWAQSQLQNNNNNNAYVFGNVGGSTQQGLNSSMNELIRQARNIPPVLKKNQGERVYIALRRDLDFSSVYGLERR